LSLQILSSVGVQQKDDRERKKRKEEKKRDKRKEDIPARTDKSNRRTEIRTNKTRNGVEATDNDAAVLRGRAGAIYELERDVVGTAAAGGEENLFFILDGRSEDQLSLQRLDLRRCERRVSGSARRGGCRGCRDRLGGGGCRSGGTAGSQSHKSSREKTLHFVQMFVVDLESNGKMKLE